MKRDFLSKQIFVLKYLLICINLLSELFVGQTGISLLKNLGSQPKGMYLIKIITFFIFFGISYPVFSQNYCIPKTPKTNLDSYFIKEITIEGLRNTTSVAAETFCDFTYLKAYLFAGQSYKISITTPAGMPRTCAAWIDYSKNGNFEDAQEKLGEVIISYTATTTITIPFILQNVIEGDSLRLRIRCAAGAASINSCSDYLSGETEDYKIIVSDFKKSAIVVPANIRLSKLCDFDNDGDLDIINKSKTDSISIQVNDNGIFKKLANNNQLIGSNILLADLNRDNFTDIISGSSVYFNARNGNYSSPSKLINTRYKILNVFDIDNDGDLDLFAAGDSAFIFTQDKTGNFLLMQKFLIEFPVLTSDVADIDNDGDIDLLVVGSKESRIFKNDGFGYFTLFNGIQAGSFDPRVSFSDYDNDGDFDILISAFINVLSGYYSPLTKIYNNQNGDFIDSHLSVNSYYKGSGDIDLNGENDFLFWDRICFNVNKSPIIHYYSDGIILLGSSYGETSGEFRAGTCGDIDNDGDLDLVTSIGIFKNLNKTGRIIPPKPINLNANIVGYSATLSWGNSSFAYTIDTTLTYNLRIGTTPGGSDILSCLSDTKIGFLRTPQYGNVGYNKKWRINNLAPGTYYFSVQSINQAYIGSEFSNEKSFTVITPFVQRIINVPSYCDHSRFVDLDDDNDFDLLSSRYDSYEVKNHLGYNTKDYALISNTQYEGTTPIPSFSDYNNDGKIDMVLTGELWDDTNKSWLLQNNGNFSFQVNKTIFESVAQGGADWGDFDNDGDNDLIIIGRQMMGTNITSIYRNDGNGVFTKIDNNLEKVCFGAVRWIDFDNDLDLDLILSGRTTSGDVFTALYENDGNNKFNITTNQFRNLEDSWIDIGDYDNDGDFDILLSGTDLTGTNICLIYKNNKGNFIELLTLTSRFVGVTSWAKSYCKWFDYDNDGDLDVYLNKVYENLGNDAFQEIELGLPVVTQDVAIGDENLDGSLDIFSQKTVYTNNIIKKNTPPSEPASLRFKAESSKVVLSWNPASDSESLNGGLSNNIRVGTTPGGYDIVSPMSDIQSGFRRVPQPGNVQANLSWQLKNLPIGTYYWSVQAIDQGYMGGKWADEQILKRSVLISDFTTDTACLGSSTSFFDKSVTLGSPITKWKWEFGDGQISSNKNPLHLYANSGTYQVKLIINSIEFSDSVTKQIIIKPKPGADFTVNVSCQGSPTTIINSTNTNGLAMSAWDWSFGDGQTSHLQNPGTHGFLNAGDYQIKLRTHAMNGCIDSIQKTASVTAYPVAVITANAPLSFCYGDSVILSVSNNPNYLYQWMLNNTAITNGVKNYYIAKTTGNYSVEVTNSKGLCKTTSSQVAVTKLVKPVTPVIVTQNYQEGKCPGANQIVLSVDQPVIEYTYQWKRNGTPISNATGSNYSGLLPGGDYSVAASQSGCKTESAVKTIVYDNAPPKPLIYVHGPNVWYLASSIADAAQYKYRWYYNESLIPGADKYIYVANRNLGNYYVTIENNKGCYTSSDVVKIPTGGISIEETDPFAGLKIYPNPSSGHFTVEIDNRAYGEFVISVSAQGGRQVLSTKFEKTTDHFSNRIDLSGQTKGMYIINLKADRYLVTRKLVVE